MWNHRRSLAALAASLPLTVLACGLFGPDLIRRRGLIDYGPAWSVDATVPDTVSVGVPFEVSVATYGGGCDMKGETEISIDSMTAVVEPFDYSKQTEKACTGELNTYRHHAEVTFNYVGTGLIRIVGRSDTDTLIVVDYETAVRQES